jgi:hypothetical protein
MTHRRLHFAWAWTLATVLLVGCASVPRTAPPFEQPTAPAALATLAVEAHDFVHPGDKIDGATVEIRTGATVLATLTTNADGYVATVLPQGQQYDIAVSKDGYSRGTASAYLTGNSQIPIALTKDAPPAPSIVTSVRPFVGPLRVEGKLFRDDTGPRRILFASWFTALRVLRDDPAEFTRQLDALTAAGYQGARVFLAVGGWMDFWDDHEVAPIGFRKWHFTGNHLRSERLGVSIIAWPNYDELYRTMLRAFKARGLRLHVTAGDMQIIVAGDLIREAELHRRFARIAAEEGGTDVIALAEMTNEFPLNRYGGQSPESIAQMGRLIEIWRQAIPGVLTAQGAIPQDEEPETLKLASRHGEVAAVHPTRSPFGMALKRTLGLVYFEGDYRAFWKALWQGEPAGPEEDSYQRLDDPASLTALYAMHALTGQASNQFSGYAVRARAPIDRAWGFRELPAVLSQLPEDIATWQRETAGRGAILYWTRGQQFATSTFVEWDSTPPRAVAEWTLYTGDRVTRGTGNPPKATGLLMGRFQ